MPMPRPLIQIEDRLRVLEVRVHLRCRIDEPCAQMLAGMVGVLFLAGQLPRRCERWNDEAEPHHRFAVVVEVGGIGEAVASDVGAVGILLIRPPVIALGEVVVRAALAPFAVRGGDGDRLLGEVSVCGGKNPRAVGCGDEVVGGGSRLCAHAGANDKVAGRSSGQCAKTPVASSSSSYRLPSPLFVQISLWP